ncbi:MAG: hypothetical protein AAF721_23985, partial [Myxococcota bacterium]
MNDPKKPKPPKRRVTARGGTSPKDLAKAVFTVVDLRESGAKFKLHKAKITVNAGVPKNTDGLTNLD